MVAYFQSNTWNKKDCFSSPWGAGTGSVHGKARVPGGQRGDTGDSSPILCLAVGWQQCGADVGWQEGSDCWDLLTSALRTLPSCSHVPATSCCRIDAGAGMLACQLLLPAWGLCIRNLMNTQGCAGRPALLGFPRSPWLTSPWGLARCRGHRPRPQARHAGGRWQWGQQGQAPSGDGWGSAGGSAGGLLCCAPASAG